LVVVIVSGVAGKHAAVPPLFIWLEGAIVLFSALLCSIPALVQWGVRMGSDGPEPDQRSQQSPRPGTFLAWWDTNQEKVQRFFVIPLAALMVVALFWLVHTTDGRTSPFVALLEAPAVLGPFIAASPVGIALSAVSVSAGIVLAITSRPLHDPNYSPGGHASVLVFAIVVAASISGVRMYQRNSREKRERRARKLAQGRPLFLVLLRYEPPRAGLHTLLQAHDEHVATLYEEGSFATPEHRTTTVGALLARAENAEAIQALMDDDPAVAGHAATYEIRAL
jgi:uncharacterized protein YciI